MVSKFNYLRRNLFSMAEICLEQVLILSDALESDDVSLIPSIYEREDRIDDLEKQNDNLSQNAILEAVANRNLMGLDQMDQELMLKNDPLRFALSAIRITRNFERLGDQVVNCASSLENQLLPPKIFAKDETLSLIVSRVVTIVGMAVESLVEQKDRFFGSVHMVEEELNSLSYKAFQKFVKDESLDKAQFADLYRIILNMERTGDYAVNIAEELVRLNTGYDIRHMDPRLIMERQRASAKTSEL